MDVPIVVSGVWLRERVGDAEIRLVDVRPPAFFNQAHLPGAVNLPGFFLSGPGGGPPPPAMFASRLGALGITRDTHVVAYDEGGSPTAARLFWLLTYFRHPRVSVLDGGITAWLHDGLDWEHSAVRPLGDEYLIGEADPAVIAVTGDVRKSIDSPDDAIVDVRSPAEFLGLQITARRNGHIPGAINLEWSNALAPDPDALMRFAPDEQINGLLESAGLDRDRKIIVYCQSGHRSAFAFMTFKKLGYTNVRNYDGGWQEWGNRDDTPVDEE